MEAIQLIQITPEELQEQISTTLKNHTEKLLKLIQPKASEDYLTRKETAKLLKVDISTIHNWTKEKKLQAYGIGGRVYYKRSEIDNSLIKLK